MKNNKLNYFVSILLFVCLLIACGKSTETNDDTKSKTQDTKNNFVNNETKSSEKNYPELQKEFFENRKTYNEEFKKWEQANNDKSQNKTYDNCCNYTGEFFSQLDYQIVNWVGIVSDVNFSSDGQFGGVFLEAGYKNLKFEFKTPYTFTIHSEDLSRVIKNGTPLFERIKTINKGDMVVFSAIVFKDVRKGIKEISITMDGYLQNPEFLIKLLNISKIGAQEPDLSNDNSNSILDELPDQQRKFIELVEEYYDKYDNAPNELKKSSLRKERKNSLKKYFSNRQVKNWIGKISQTGTTGDGQAWIEVTLLSSNIKIETMNNRFSDIMSNTLISNGSKVYNQISELSNGDKIYFSGIFITDTHEENLNYLKEISLTENGSMMEPEFILKFTNIEKK